MPCMLRVSGLAAVLAFTAGWVCAPGCGGRTGLASGDDARDGSVGPDGGGGPDGSSGSGGGSGGSSSSSGGSSSGGSGSSSGGSPGSDGGCPAQYPGSGACDSNGLSCPYPGRPCTCTSVCPPGSCCPTSCAQAGFPCGVTGDGCGNTLKCRICPPGQTCGNDRSCGPAADAGCTPRACPSSACGWIDDGCGGQVECGDCYWSCVLAGP